MPDQSLYSILLPIDGSEQANRAAAYVAQATLGPRTVELLYVDPPHGRQGRDEGDAQVRCGDATENASRLLEQADIAYRTRCDSGEPAQRITAHLDAGDHDEVVLGTRGLGSVANLALGSVAYRVVHAAAKPVTLVPPARHGEPGNFAGSDANTQRILLAVDGSDPSAHAARFVCGLRTGGAALDIQLLNVQLPILSGNVRRFVSQDTIKDYYREEGETALAGAKQLLHDAGLRFDSHIVAGPVAQTIVEQAERLGCTRIVMGTRGLGAVANAVLGSIAFKAIHLSSLPITLVK